MAARAEEFAAAISPRLTRTKADTLATEVLPLLAGCKFLEREAERILAPHRLGVRGRPLWMTGVAAEIHRVALGHVLVIGPSNFPLFIPGSHVLQALAAGNRVTWKPGLGGGAVAQLMARMLVEAGLPESALTVTDESVEAAREALAARPDKVIFTGSTKTSQSLLAELAETTTPAVLELSGADAIVVTPTADLQAGREGGCVRVAVEWRGGVHVAAAVVCYAFDDDGVAAAVACRACEGAARPRWMRERRCVCGRCWMRRLVEAQRCKGRLRRMRSSPLLVDHATANMAIAGSDIFAPVISLIEAESMMHVPALYAQCSYGLTVAIFCERGKEKKARMLGRC